MPYNDAMLQRTLGAPATTAIMFRMCSPDALPDAAERFYRQFRRLGPMLPEVEALAS